MKIVFVRFIVIVALGSIITACSTNAGQKNCWEKAPAITFQPLQGPVTILWYPGDGFSVELAKSIPTIVGSFGVEQEIGLYRRGTCVMLIIQDDNLPPDQRFQIVNLDLANSKVELQFYDDVMRDAVIEFEGQKFDIKKNDIEYLHVEDDTIWINATNGHVKRLDITPLPSNTCYMASDPLRESNKCRQGQGCNEFKYIRLYAQDVSALVLLSIPRKLTCNQDDIVGTIVYWCSKGFLIIVFIGMFYVLLKKQKDIYALIVSVVFAWSLYILIAF